MQPPEKSNRFQFIGGAIIVVAAFVIMAPGLFAFFFGLGRMFILIGLALVVAFAITKVTSARAIERKAAANIEKKSDGKDAPRSIEKQVDTKIDS